MKLRGTGANHVRQISNDGCFTVFKTRRDLGQNDIAISKVGITLTDLVPLDYRTFQGGRYTVRRHPTLE